MENDVMLKIWRKINFNWTMTIKRFSVCRFRKRIFHQHFRYIIKQSTGEPLRVENSINPKLIKIFTENISSISAVRSEILNIYPRSRFFDFCQWSGVSWLSRAEEFMGGGVSCELQRSQSHERDVNSKWQQWDESAQERNFPNHFPLNAPKKPFVFIHLFGFPDTRE